MNSFNCLPEPTFLGLSQILFICSMIQIVYYNQLPCCQSTQTVYQTKTKYLEHIELFNPFMQNGIPTEHYQFAIFLTLLGGNFHVYSI